jgi:hypothetical protein
MPTPSGRAYLYFGIFSLAAPLQLWSVLGPRTMQSHVVSGVLAAGSTEIEAEYGLSVSSVASLETSALCKPLYSDELTRFV